MFLNGLMPPPKHYDIPALPKDDDSPIASFCNEIFNELGPQEN